jgi:hypothetical protein
MSTVEPLGGARAGDLRASTINAKKHRWRVPWEVPKLEIQERPPSVLRNIDGRPLASVDGDPGAPTINVRNVDGVPLGGAGAGDLGMSTINAKKHR